MKEAIVQFICLLCAPLHKVSSYLNSPSNLRKHIELMLQNIVIVIWFN